MVLSRLIALILLVLGLPIAWAEEVWVHADQYGAFHIVLAEHASPNEQLAANEFQHYWKAVTGCDVAISPSPEGEVNVWIGRSCLPESWFAADSARALGKDGIRIRTYPSAEDDSGKPELYLVGEGERGTLYAVYDFVERYLGVRWLTPEFTHIPTSPPEFLPVIDYAFTPPIAWRECSYLDPATDATTFRRVHKLDDAFIHGPFGGHTLYDLVPPETYFASHPEYFAEINGKRVAPVKEHIRGPAQLTAESEPVGQLCCSNPEVAEIIADRILKMIAWDDPAVVSDPAYNNLRALVGWHPSKKVWSVAQMDWFGNCQCPACKAIDEHEGSPMGSLLTMVNRVADIVGAKYPDQFIHTFAYLYSVPAPKHLRPRDNVIVELCTIQFDFSRPLNDPAAALNRSFAHDLDAWSAICHNLYIWDYIVNFLQELQPHPNHQVLQPNLKFFSDHGVKGVYEQANEGMPLPRTGFHGLRDYIVLEALWNPDVDTDTLIREYTDLYYGASAPYIREYLALMAQRVTPKDFELLCFMDSKWLDVDLVTQAQAIFRKAFDAADSDLVREHVAQAYTEVECAALLGAPTISFHGNTVHIDRAPAPDLDDYVARLVSYGIADRPGSLDVPLADLHESLPAGTPPQNQRFAIEKIENDAYALWVVPEYRGTILRWYDKQHKVELLRGFETLSLDGPGVWQDWTTATDLPQHAVAETYDVVERTPSALTIRATLGNGLEVERRMTLAPNGGPLEVTLTLTNRSNVPVTPGVKMHPEFATQGTRLPKVWAEEQGVWRCVNPDTDKDTEVAGAMLDVPGLSRVACRIPRKRLTLVNEFAPDGLNGVLWFGDITEKAQHINLELIPDDAPIAPGDARSVTGRYYVTRKRPRSL